MAETRDNNLANTLSNSQFDIPEYQRGYVWGETQVNDLLSDIEFIMENEVDHYFGNFVLSKQNGNDNVPKRIESYNIIDGQQRLTTITILFSNMYWMAEEIKSNIKDSFDQSHERNIAISEFSSLQSICKSGFLLSMEDEVDSQNLILKTADKQSRVYQDIALNPPADRMVTNPQMYSGRMLKSTDETIWDWLTGYRSTAADLDDYEEIAKELKEIVDIIKGSFNITQYIVEDENEAGRIFAVINDRGKDLNIADKVKSTLIYNTSKIGDDGANVTKEIHGSFATVYENVAQSGSGRNEINRFMKAHWVVFTGVTDKNLDNIHRIISSEDYYLGNSKKNDDVKKNWIKAYINSLVDFAKSYAEINTYGSSTDSKTKEIETINYYLSNIATGYFLPMQIAGNLYLDNSEYLDILRSLEEISVKYHEVANRGNQTFRSQSEQQAHKIHCAHYNSKHNNLDPMYSLYPNSKKGDSYKDLSKDEVVRKTESKAGDKISTSLEENIGEYLSQNDIIDGTGYRDWGGIDKRVLRYVLYRMDESNNKPNIWTDNTDIKPTIEHVRPESRSNEDASNKVNNLGNLAILESKINKNCDDMDLNSKIPKYKDSKFSIYEDISQYTKRDWSDTHIDNRSSNLRTKFSNTF